MTVQASQAGYTLSEMLAALLIVGLAMGGLVEGGFELSRLQAVSARGVRLYEAGVDLQRRFAALIDDLGPVRSAADLQGSPTALSFSCGPHDCGASLKRLGRETHLLLQRPMPLDLPLGEIAEPHFLYVDAGEFTQSWPRARNAPQRLDAVLLVSGEGQAQRTLASARIWRQEPSGCRFDEVVKDCRGAP